MNVKFILSSNETFCIVKKSGVKPKPKIYLLYERLLHELLSRNTSRWHDNEKQFSGLIKIISTP